MAEVFSAVELRAQIRSGQRSAADIVQESLRRAEAYGDELGAFVALSPDLAMDAARRVDADPELGQHGALAGLPIPIKDLTEVAGLPFEAGSAALRGNIATSTDWVAQQFLDAGAAVIGKTSSPEFGFPCYTEPDGRPPAVTPWDVTRGAGGSSGGAAAAVASGIVPIAHASDGGGSIRIPAVHCGVVGLKASRGLWPTGPIRVPGPGLVTDGVITRTVADTALALDAMCRDLPGVTFRAPRPDGGFLAALQQSVRPLRIGVLTDPVISDDAVVDPERIAAVLRAADLLEKLGHHVASAWRPFTADRWAAFDAIWTTGAAGLPLPPEAEPLLTPMTRWLRARGQQVTGAQFAEAVANIQRLTWEVADSWDADFDVVLTPTVAEPPLPVGTLRNDDDPATDFAAQIRHTPWTSIANLTGRPSISIPGGLDSNGLPTGLMFTGPFGADATLLQLAAQLEAATPWALVPPRYLNR